MNKYRDWPLPRLQGRVLDLARRTAPPGISKEELSAWLAGYDKELSAALAQAEQDGAWQEAFFRDLAEAEAERQAEEKRQAEAASA